MVVVPGMLAVTTPDDEFILPIGGTLLLHVPPPVASVSVTVPPTHALSGPLIGAGSGLTVKTIERKQPVDNT
jgi:hypothetical protein